LLPVPTSAPLFHRAAQRFIKVVCIQAILEYQNLDYGSFNSLIASTKIIFEMAAAGRTAAKVLGINLDYRKEEPLSGAASISSVETCKEQLLLSDASLTTHRRGT
jgi:hypothetical protein